MAISSNYRLPFVVGNTYGSATLANPYIQLGNPGVPGDGLFMNGTDPLDETFDPNGWVGVERGGSRYMYPTGATVNQTQSGVPPFDGYSYDIGNNLFFLGVGQVAQDNFTDFLRIYDGSPNAVRIKIGTMAARTLDGSNGIILGANGQVNWGTFNITPTSVWDTTNMSYVRNFNIFTTTDLTHSTFQVALSNTTGWNTFNLNTFVAGLTNGVATDLGIHYDDTATPIANLGDINPGYVVGADYWYRFLKNSTTPSLLDWSLFTNNLSRDLVFFNPNRAYETFLTITDLQNGNVQNYSQRTAATTFTITTHGGKPRVYVRGPLGNLVELQVTGSNGAWVVNSGGYDLSNGVVVDNPFDRITGTAMTFNDGTNFTVAGIPVTFTQVNHDIMRYHRRWNLAPHQTFDFLGHNTSLWKQDSRVNYDIGGRSEFGSGDDLVFTTDSFFANVNRDPSQINPSKVRHAVRTALPGEFHWGLGFDYVYENNANYLDFNIGFEYSPDKDRIFTLGGSFENMSKLESGKWTNAFDTMHGNIFTRFAIPANYWIGGDINFGVGYTAQKAPEDSGMNYQQYHSNQLGAQLVLFPYSAVSVRGFWDSETIHENFGSFLDNSGAGRKSTERTAGVGLFANINRIVKLYAQYSNISDMAYYNSNFFGLNMFGASPDFVYREGHRYEGGISWISENYGIHALTGHYATFTFPGGANPNESSWGIGYRAKLNNWGFNFDLERREFYSSYFASSLNPDNITQSLLAGAGTGSNFNQKQEEWYIKAGVTYTFPLQR